jgi:hypothetical protein
MPNSYWDKDYRPLFPTKETWQSEGPHYAPGSDFSPGGPTSTQANRCSYCVSGLGFRYCSGNMTHCDCPLCGRPASRNAPIKTGALGSFTGCEHCGIGFHTSGEIGGRESLVMWIACEECKSKGNNDRMAIIDGRGQTAKCEFCKTVHEIRRDTLGRVTVTKRSRSWLDSLFS